MGIDAPMPLSRSKGKVHHLLGDSCDPLSHWKSNRAFCRVAAEVDMGALALAMFIGLYGFGSELIGYADSDGKVKLAVFVAFMLGIVCGYRTGK
jgi:hypothetical protein